MHVFRFTFKLLNTFSFVEKNVDVQTSKHGHKNFSRPCFEVSYDLGPPAYFNVPRRGSPVPGCGAMGSLSFLVLRLEIL